MNSIYDNKPVLCYDLTITPKEEWKGGTCYAMENVCVRLFMGRTGPIQEEIIRCLRNEKMYDTAERATARADWLDMARKAHGATSLVYWDRHTLVRYDDYVSTIGEEPKVRTSMVVEPSDRTVQAMGATVDLLTSLAGKALAREYKAKGYGKPRAEELTTCGVDRFLRGEDGGGPMGLLRQLDAMKTPRVQGTYCRPLRGKETYNETHEWLIIPGPRPLVRAERPAMVEEQALAAR